MIDKCIYKELSYSIVGILFEALNLLGYGYQEKYYEKALIKLFSDAGIKFKNQVPFKISIKGEVIGRYYLDFIIEDKVVLEIKRGYFFPKTNIEQVQGYLKVTNLKLAILANFSPSGIKYKRILNSY